MMIDKTLSILFTCISHLSSSFSTVTATTTSQTTGSSPSLSSSIPPSASAPISALPPSRPPLQSIESDQFADYYNNNPTATAMSLPPPPPAFSFMEFQLRVHVEQPGIIIGYVDRQIPATKALEVAFPAIDVNMLYQNEFGKDHSLIPTVAINIPTVTLAPPILDLIGVLISSKTSGEMGMKEDVKPTHGNKVEEKAQGVITAPFYEEEETETISMNQCM